MSDKEKLLIEVMADAIDLAVDVRGDAGKAATAALSALEAAGVRLVPSEATAEMVNGAVSRRFKSYLTKSDDMYADIYTAMLAVSPYAALKETASFTDDPFNRAVLGLPLEPGQ